jgi:hypothetical protein
LIRGWAAIIPDQVLNKLVSRNQLLPVKVDDDLIESVLELRETLEELKKRERL